MYWLFPTPDSRLPTPDSRLPTPDSRLPTPDSRLLYLAVDWRLQTGDWLLYYSLPFPLFYTLNPLSGNVLLRHARKTFGSAVYGVEAITITVEVNWNHKARTL